MSGARRYAVTFSEFERGALRDAGHRASVDPDDLRDLLDALATARRDALEEAALYFEERNRKPWTSMGANIETGETWTETHHGIILCGATIAKDLRALGHPAPTPEAKPDV